MDFTKLRQISRFFLQRATFLHRAKALVRTLNNFADFGDDVIKARVEELIANDRFIHSKEVQAP